MLELDGRPAALLEEESEGVDELLALGRSGRRNGAELKESADHVQPVLGLHAEHPQHRSAAENEHDLRGHDGLQHVVDLPAQEHRKRNHGQTALADRERQEAVIGRRRAVEHEGRHHACRVKASPGTTAPRLSTRKKTVQKVGPRRVRRKPVKIGSPQ